MKRLGAIFMITVHLASLFGGYAVFIRQDNLNTRRLSVQLDNDEYTGSDAVTIRIPFSLPYSNYPATYERADGSFEHEGQLYRRVKQKLLNDTLYVVCVIDNEGTEIKNEFKDNVASYTDHASDSTSHGKTAIQLIKDFEPPLSAGVVPGKFFCYSIGAYGYFDSEPSHPHLVVDYPPKV